MEGSTVKRLPRGLYRVGRLGAGAGCARAVRRAAAGSRVQLHLRRLRPGRRLRSTSGSSPPARSRSPIRRRPSAGPPAGRAWPRSTPTEPARDRVPMAPRRSARTGIPRRRSATPCSGSSSRSSDRATSLDAQRRRHDPLPRNPLQLPGPGQSDRSAHRVPDHQRQRRDARAEADRLQLSTCARPRSRCATVTAPAPSTSYTWNGAARSVPAARHLHRRLLRPQHRGRRAPGRRSAELIGLNNNALTTNGNAANHQHWTQVYCGHEIQINESLNGGGPQPSTDPIKTGSVYGFRNLNAAAVASDRTSASARAPGTRWRSARSASSTRSWSTAR